MNDIVNYYFLEEQETPSFITESTRNQLQKTIDYLNDKKKILLLCTSNRWSGSDDIPKSTLLARHIQDQLIGQTTLIDVTKLHIYDCEGNVSDKLKGNHCGTKDAVLKDKEKNPSGCHRCWCSINHEDDELWKVSKELLQSDVVLFFGSVRWGQTNAVYQRLIERLTWLENRHSTLKETNILKDIEAGTIMIGQNWNGSDVIKTQKQVLEFYGFKVPKELSWNWQFTDNPKDETKESYEEAPKTFKKEFLKK
jgi:multimeric flavodoxin WrbA